MDESVRGGYLLAATTVAPVHLAVVRRCLRALLMPGERRVHFQAESDPRRRKIVSELTSLHVETVIYVARGRDDRARAACLSRAVEDCRRLGAQRLVLESRGQAQDRKDRRTIAQVLAGGQHGLKDPMAYLHLQCYEEPALWIPDAVAWCYGAGGQWRMRVGPLIKEIVDLRAT
ncbi:hypothetical protein ACFQ1L_12200 [Phytohabitans flavus]|uniref:Uncharacterized protein n=1 Tax=Phytohabitans flavus TaxID=1076124 RepID=A0A6F8XZ59_9ACTN|nr:hypothetical protein [Phytohabitans flavus]BCB79079.1 hypothetical protein Pflav_054890 [Phytohabitans flavus]